MKWTRKEDEIVCSFYLNHQNDWRAKIDILMNELKNAGFANRIESSVVMRIGNFISLHTGSGLSHVSKQSKDVYNSLT